MANDWLIDGRSARNLLRAYGAPIAPDTQSISCLPSRAASGDESKTSQSNGNDSSSDDNRDGDEPPAAAVVAK